MHAKDIIEKVKAHLAEADVIEAAEDVIDPYLIIKPQAVRKAVEFMLQDSDLLLDGLHSIAGIDYGKYRDNKIGCAYVFTSFKHKHWFTLKTEWDNRDKCEVETLSDLYDTANWHERETFDLVGITFKNHPNLVRILCAEDWEGHPLRKDYELPKTYHGIDCEGKVEWNSHPITFPPPKKK